MKSLAGHSKILFPSPPPVVPRQREVQRIHNSVLVVVGAAYSVSLSIHQKVIETADDACLAGSLPARQLLDIPAACPNSFPLLFYVNGRVVCPRLLALGDGQPEEKGGNIIRSRRNVRPYELVARGELYGLRIGRG